MDLQDLIDEDDEVLSDAEDIPAEGPGRRRDILDEALENSSADQGNRDRGDKSEYNGRVSTKVRLPLSSCFEGRAHLSVGGIMRDPFGLDTFAIT